MLVTNVNQGPNTITSKRPFDRAVVIAPHSKQGLLKCLSPCLTMVHLSALRKVSYLSIQSDTVQEQL